MYPYGESQGDQHLNSGTCEPERDRQTPNGRDGPNLGRLEKRSINDCNEGSATDETIRFSVGFPFGRERFSFAHVKDITLKFSYLSSLFINE